VGYEVTGEVETIHMSDPSRGVGFGSGEYYVVDQNGDGEITYEEDLCKVRIRNPGFLLGTFKFYEHQEF